MIKRGDEMMDITVTRGKVESYLKGRYDRMDVIG